MHSRCRAFAHPSGTLAVIHPAMAARDRPRRVVGVRTETRVVRDYDFAAGRVVEREESVEVPVFEPVHTDEAWAARCLALTWAKHPEWHGCAYVDVDPATLPPPASRAEWRLCCGGVVDASHVCGAPGRP